MLSRRRFIKSGAFAAGALFAANPRTLNAARRAKAPELDSAYIYFCPDPVEITSPGPLVQADGTVHCSWSRRPYLDLNFEDARFLSVPYLQRYRMKKWDMFHVLSPDLYVQFLVAWIGYGAFCSAVFYDRKKRKRLDDIKLFPPRPEIPMMRNSTSGRTVCERGKLKCIFEVQQERMSIDFKFPGFAKLGLSAGINLEAPRGHESICAVHPVNPKRAFYSHKITCLPATGEVRLGRDSFQLRPEDSFGMLDFGRGYYPHRYFWFWSTTSGRDERGKLVGWNLGYGNSPEENLENAVFYDGKLHKIGTVKCECDFQDPYQEWRVWTEDGRVDLTLTPENAGYNQLDIGLLYTRGKTALGLYNGRLVLDSGEKIKIKDMFGLYEWMDQKW